MKTVRSIIHKTTARLTSVFFIATFLASFSILTPQVVRALEVAYNFNSTNLIQLLTNDFRQGLGGNNSFGYNVDGGLNNSASVDVLHKNNIWTTREAYASPVDSETVTLSGYFFSTNASGYGGLGISGQHMNTPANNVPNPKQGIGVVFHGSSGDFMVNGESLMEIWWANGDFNLHEPNWWFMELEITRDGSAYDMHFEIHQTDETGGLTTLHSEHDITNIPASTIDDPATIWPYFGATSGRFSMVDDFRTDATPVTEEPVIPSPFAGGEGSSLSPFLINDCAQLQAIGSNIEYLSAYYELGSDIDCSMTNPDDEDFDDTGPWATSKGFNPIGSTTVPFTGHLDGMSYSVDGMHINRGEEVGVGLFGYISEDSTVQDINLTNSFINSLGDAGSLAGISLGTISNSSASGGVVSGAYEVGGLVGAHGGFDTIIDSWADISVYGEWAVGGLVGSNYYLGNVGNVVNSYALGDVEGDQSVGGLVGENNQGSISGSHATGSVTGNLNVGGLLGYGLLGSVDNSYATGDVSAVDASAGGLVGIIVGASVEDSYATGEVHGGDDTGGLVGVATTAEGWEDLVTGEWIEDYESPHIAKSYATGNVIGENYIGGLIGAAIEGTIDQSFSMSEVSGSSEVGGLVGTSIGFTIQDSYARGDVYGSHEETQGVGGAIGINLEGSTLHNVYATGRVTSDAADFVGGLIGQDHDSFTENSFWDTETTGLSTSAGGTGKDTASMKDSATFTNLNTDGLDESWDFAGNPHNDASNNDMWSISTQHNDGYPCLVWQTEADNCTDLGVQPDGDNDGISDEIENAGPNNGDANNDGTPDSQQAHVASFVNSITNKHTVIVVDAACAISSASIVHENDATTKDSGFDYLTGLVSFSADCGTPGFTSIVSVYQYGLHVNSLVLRKYIPANSAYFTVTGSSINQQIIDEQHVTVATYAVTDGGQLDIDNEANGIIVDPVGLARATIGVPNTGLGTR